MFIIITLFLPGDYRTILWTHVKSIPSTSGEVPKSISSDKKVPFVPLVIKADLVTKIYHSNGHLGLQVTCELMKTRYWWPKMKTELV